MAEKVVIGNAELWHGDCREVLPLLPACDLILTDPPYGIGFAAQPTMYQRKQQFEAEVAAKDAEIMEQCRLNGMGAEREATLIGKVAQQSAALKLAREALFDMQDSYAAVHGWKDSFVIAATTAIAAIDSLQKGE